MFVKSERNFPSFWCQENMNGTYDFNYLFHLGFCKLFVLSFLFLDVEKNCAAGKKNIFSHQKGKHPLISYKSDNPLSIDITLQVSVSLSISFMRILQCQYESQQTFQALHSNNCVIIPVINQQAATLVLTGVRKLLENFYRTYN